MAMPARPGLAMLSRVGPYAIASRDHRELNDGSRLIRSGEIAVVALGVILVLARLSDLAQASSPPYPIALAVLLPLLPLQVWLALSATQPTRRARELVGLALLAGVIVLAMPFVGLVLVGELYAPAALALALYGRPWGVAVFVGLAVTVTPLTIVFSHPDWASYFTIGLLTIGLVWATSIWLVRTARQLQLARLELANQAVLDDRGRVHDEIESTLGRSLEEISGGAESAKALVDVDPAAAEVALHNVVATSRAAMGATKRLVVRYRERSLAADVAAAASLLRAAGIAVDSEVSLDSVRPGYEVTERLALRNAVSAALTAPDPAAVRVVITLDDRGLRVDVRPGGAFEPDPSRPE